MRRGLPTLLASIGLVAGVAHAQTPQPRPTPAPGVAFRDATEVEWVLVSLIVRKGRDYVTDLRQDEITLFVDDRPVPLDSFERSDTAPWSLVFLADLSGSMGNSGKLDLARQGFETFLRLGRPGDQTALVTFAGGSTTVDVPFTDDLDQLRASMGTWSAYGVTALHDAVSWLPELDPGRDAPAKRAAVLVTDGADNASVIGPDEARDLVRQAKLPVYVLGLGTGSPYARGAQGESLFRYANVLHLLAYATGGRYTPVTEARIVEEACAAIAADLRHQYVLGFATGGAGIERYRKIRVEVGRKGLQVTHRLGYRGRRPAVSLGR